MRARKVPLDAGRSVVVYHDEKRIVLQMNVQGAELSPSFQVAVDLNPTDALELADALLSVVVGWSRSRTVEVGREPSYTAPA